MYSEADLNTYKPNALSGAEGGIRTHAPFRTNGFQDRLVMTTSIPLRLLLNNINTEKVICQDFLQYFFIIFIILKKQGIVGILYV